MSESLEEKSMFFLLFCWNFVTLWNVKSPSFRGVKSFSLHLRNIGGAMDLKIWCQRRSSEELWQSQSSLYVDCRTLRDFFSKNTFCTHFKFIQCRMEIRTSHTPAPRRRWRERERSNNEKMYGKCSLPYINIKKINIRSYSRSAVPKNIIQSRDFKVSLASVACRVWCESTGQLSRRYSRSLMW